MKRGIALAAVALAMMWCAVSSAALAPEVEEALALAAGTYPLEFEPLSATSGNSVLIESASVLAKHWDTIGVYITNDEAIRNFTIPLIIRSLTPGSYVKYFTASYNEQSRVANYLTGLYEDSVYIQPVINTYARFTSAAPTGPGSAHSPRFIRPPEPPDYISPDGLLLSRNRILPSDNLPAGSDGIPGDGTPMATITFWATHYPGSFEIDTCCIEPAHHLMFIPGTGPVVAVIPSFTKAVITIEPIPGSVVIPDTVVTEPPEIVADDAPLIELHGDTTTMDDPGALVSDPPPGTPIVHWILDSTAAGDADGDKSSEALSSAGAVDPVSNYPNPFNSATTIRYSLDASRKVTVVVYDLLGRTVSTLVDAYQPPGDYNIPWEGRDAYGRSVPAGIYFYRVQNGDLKSVGKMVLLK